MTASATQAVVAVGSGPSELSLVVLHTRYQVRETLRVPIAVLGNLFFPGLALVFFVVPQDAVAHDQAAATAAVAQLAMFAVISTFIFNYGVGVAEDRALPFDAYLRTLPAGPLPRLGGRLLSGIVFSLISLFPLLIIGWLGTDAWLSLPRLLAGVAMVIIGGLPFLFMGFAIGYGLSLKAALPIAQVVLFPMAFAGGLFLPPEMFPSWLDTFSGFLPSRAGRDTVVYVTTGSGATAFDVVVLVVWTVAMATLAVWTYQRDQGRRFR